MSKQQDLKELISKITITSVRVSKTLVSEQGDSHTVEMGAELDGVTVSEATVVAHILGMKVESTAQYHLSNRSQDEPSLHMEKQKKIKSSYGILIASEMENINK